MARTHRTPEATSRAVVAAYQADPSPTRVAQLFNLSCGTVCRILTRYNAPKMRLRPLHKIPRLERPQIVERYQRGESMRCLARERRVTIATIKRVIKAAELPIRSASQRNRRYTIDETVFDNPTPEGEYWIGFLMADGYVGYREAQKSWHIRLGLADVDAAHVAAFRDFLRTDAPLIHIRAKTDRATGYVSRPTVALDIHSALLAKSLARYGVVPRKSKTARVIGLEQSAHFWRGAVDGDGFVTTTGAPRHHRPLLGLVGSRQLMDQFAHFAKSIASGIKAVVCRKGSICSFRVSGTNAIPVLKTLYSDCPVALSRKHEPAKKLIQLGS